VDRVQGLKTVGKKKEANQRLREQKELNLLTKREMKGFTIIVFTSNAR